VLLLLLSTMLCISFLLYTFSYMHACLLIENLFRRFSKEVKKRIMYLFNNSQYWHFLWMGDKAFEERVFLFYCSHTCTRVTLFNFHFRSYVHLGIWTQIIFGENKGYPKDTELFSLSLQFFGCSFFSPISLQYFSLAFFGIYNLYYFIE